MTQTGSAPPRADAPITEDGQATGAALARPTRRWPIRLPAPGIIASAVVVAVGVALRTWTPSQLWLDEAQSVYIAHQPLAGLVKALRHDGAPPLYYLLLHWWISVFGDSNVAVRSLSGLFSVTALPVMWVVARRHGRFTALAAILLLASAPMAIYFSTEARMYSLLMLLALVGAALLYRVLDRPSLGPAIALAVVTGLLALTHYWAFFLIAAVAVLLVWRLRVPAQRRTAMVALAALAGGGILFLPWLPSFVFQLRHTGTPWADPGSLNNVVAVVGQWSADAQSASFPNSTAVLPTARLLEVAMFGLATLGVFGRALDDRRRIELDMTGRPEGRPLVLVVYGTLIIGIGAGIIVHSGFQPRYSSLVMVLFIVLVALGVYACPARLRVAVLAVVILLGFANGASNLVNTSKTQAGSIAKAIRTHARQGSVVAYCPDQLAPAINRLLGAGYDQVTYPNFGSGQGVDWVDYGKRNAASNPRSFSRRLLTRAGKRPIFLVWFAGYRTLEGKCEKLSTDLALARTRSTVLVSADNNDYEKAYLIRFKPSG